MKAGTVEPPISRSATRGVLVQLVTYSVSDVSETVLFDACRMPFNQHLSRSC